VVEPPAEIVAASLLSPSLTTLSFSFPTASVNVLDALKTPPSPSSFTTAPTPIALKSRIAASAPRWPALWISAAATDSG
jgi:hypothetical protein